MNVAMSEAFYSSIDVIIIISFSPLMIMLDYAADIKLFYESHLTVLTFIF